jgi:Tat protein secretion system quality control protein TatD with DNase activity
MPDSQLTYKYTYITSCLFVIGLLFAGPVSADPYGGTISDAHTHVRDGVKYKHVINSMDKSGVDIAVIMSHDEDVTDEDVLEFHNEYPDRIIPAISFQHSRWRNQDPEYIDYVNKLAAQGEYHWLGEASVRGKIDGNLNMPPDHQMLHQLLEASIKHKLPVSIHHNSSDQAEVDAFIKTLEQHPDATVIWAHWCGLGTAERTRRLMEKLPNLYCDTAWLHKEQEDLLVPLVDDDNQFLPEWKKLIEDKPERFLVGVDASRPGHYKKKKYRKWVEKIRNALGGLNPEVAEMIASKNLHRILNEHK